MPTQVIMPALGMSQDTGRLVAWLKNEGDTVQQGEPIMEIETDKTTVEVEAAAAGILSGVSARPGEDVPVGQVIALIVGPTENAVETAAVKAPTPIAKRVAAVHGVNVEQVPAQGRRVTKADVEAYVKEPAMTPALRPASPKARRLAAERNINLEQVNGTGPDHAVLAADVLQHTQSQTESGASEPILPSQTSPLWQRMAQRLTESWQTIPHFYLKREVNAEHLVSWKQSVQNRSQLKITYTDLLVKLTAAALSKHPQMNGQWTGDAVRVHPHIHIGLAVAVEDGLLVPVIHDADKLGILAIAERRTEIVTRAQQGKLRPGDLENGTFTMSNLGMYAVDEFSAIVNPPQAAILAVGRIADRVIALQGEAVIKPMLTLSLSCDHRVVDGARGAQFLSTLAQYIEDPLSITD